MQLQLLKVSACYESETNPRGTEFENASFDELVASVKEKGVLVPVLVRPRPAVGKEFEIVAGNRRFRAAQKLKLETIPAQVREMTDDEAAEAQIVENLQRADVHPLEEGEAYRKLIEDKGYDVKNLALRMGKSESYVRQRLFLTNLIPAAAKKYRRGELTEAHAVLVAKLTPEEQKAALKFLTEGYGGMPDAGDLKDWITEQFYQPLAYQPWQGDAEVAKVVGPCKFCPPNRPSLFGAIKEGECTDLRCWGNKMAAYLKWRLDKEQGLVMVTKTYGTPSMKGAVSQSDYTATGTRKKDHCDFAEQGIVVEGPDIGTTLTICRSAECGQHHADHSNSGYAVSPQEKARRRKEREREEAKREKFDLAVRGALERVTWPLSEQHLDALLDLALAHSGTSFVMPIVKRHGLKADKTADGRDYRAPLRRIAEAAGADGKLRMIFELHLPTYWAQGDDHELKRRIAML